MLKIFNNLEPFFNDCYRRINVREYARLIKISPPSASKLLVSFERENLLVKEHERNYIYYRANIKSKLFIDLSRSYWSIVLKKCGLIEYAEKNLISPLVILFGSLSKAEARPHSDIDIAIFTISKKELNFDLIEKKAKRNIQAFVFKNIEEVKNKDLLKNMLNGYIITGGW